MGRCKLQIGIQSSKITRFVLYVKRASQTVSQVKMKVTINAWKKLLKKMDLRLLKIVRSSAYKWQKASKIENSQAQESFLPSLIDADIDDNKSTSSEHHADKDASENEKSKTICRFFRNGNCKYGMTGKECKFTNPKVRCNRGKKCKDFHPKMCINSLRKGECFSETCGFHHVKGTKRHPL